jgi:hypothetical protein
MRDRMGAFLENHRALLYAAWKLVHKGNRYVDLRSTSFRLDLDRDGSRGG